MAVVSISRIQVRRGRKNQGTGLPQLASGEFGWAVDTQELFIGNGSVAEGSPYVGNTKLLTEHDNLFEFASTYTYKVDSGFIQTGTSPNSPIQRTLQERLDDIVSVKSFGAAGDGVTDDTAAIQRAIFQLFLNNANKVNANSRVVLYMEPGIYVVSGTILMSSFVTIKGAGAEKTIIQSNTNAPVFKTINFDSTPTNIASDATTNTTNQPKEIDISGLTLRLTNANGKGFYLPNIINSNFNDIQIFGAWDFVDGENFNNYGVKLDSIPGGGVTCVRNYFNIVFNRLSFGVLSDYDITENTFERCFFNTHFKGFGFGLNTTIGLPGQGSGPINNTIENCSFQDVAAQAIHVAEGRRNISKGNKFFNVGYDGSTAVSVAYPVIEFAREENASIDDWFQRNQDLGYNSSFFNNVPFIPCVKGPTTTENPYTHVLTIGYLPEPSKFLKLPAEETTGIEVTYLYKSNTLSCTRKGKLHITVDPVNQYKLLSDEYDYIGDDVYRDTLDFSVDLYDENADAVVDTVAINVLNSNVVEDAEFHYTYKIVT